jgi:hypothetical protein
MRGTIISGVGILACLLAISGFAYGQCSLQVELSERAFFRSNGHTYTNEIIDLEVNHAGFWVNGQLSVPFVSTVDKLLEEQKGYLRSRQAYRAAALGGANDREALLRTLKASSAAIDKMHKLTSDVSNMTELNEIKGKVMADSLIGDFVSDITWSEEDSSYKYKTHEYNFWITVIQSCISGDKTILAPTEELGEIESKVKVFCEKLEEVTRLEMQIEPGRFIGMSIDKGKAFLSNTNEARLLDSLEKMN